ncbi:MAG: hypothetical protein AAF497_06275 [Planctomycetota bacterium]
MSHNQQQIIEKWRIPSLRKHAFACVIRDREFGELSSDELDLAVQQLPGKFSEPLRFHSPGGFDTTGESRAWPSRGDFESEQEFEIADQLYHDRFKFKPKPWLERDVIRAEKELTQTVRQFLTFCINDKQYVVRNKAGEEESITRWRTFDEEEQVATLEAEHLESVKGLAAHIATFLTGDVRVFETNHLCDTATITRYDWICFCDKTLALVDDAHIVLLWTGRDSFYG